MRNLWKPPLWGMVFSHAARVLHPQSPMVEKDIQTLVQEVMKNQRKQASEFTEYTADRTTICRDLNWRGVIVEETTVSEHYQSWNRNLDVILSVNGKMRSAGEIQEDREEAVSFMEIDMKEKPTSPNAEGREYGSRRGNLFMSVFQIYRNAVFSNYRTEQLEGRSVIVLDLSPRPELNRKPLPVDHLCGSVWIDAADRVTIKLIARLAPATGKNEPVFVQAYSRTPEGVWLGSYTRLNPSVKPEFFNGETYDWIIESRDYRRFWTGTVVVRPEKPKN
jgi:hypothetical protein